MMAPSQTPMINKIEEQLRSLHTLIDDSNGSNRTLAEEVADVCKNIFFFFLNLNLNLNLNR